MIIQLVDFRNREIAGMLGMQPATAKKHLNNIYRKLNIRGGNCRVQLALWAMSHPEVFARPNAA